MSTTTFTITSPEFWDGSQDYSYLYYNGLWTNESGTETSGNLYVENSPNSFWDDHADDVLLKVMIRGSAPMEDGFSLSCFVRGDMYQSLYGHTEAEIDFTGFGFAVRDLTQIGWAAPYSYGAAQQYVSYVGIVTDASAVLLWRYPVNTREKL